MSANEAPVQDRANHLAQEISQEDIVAKAQIGMGVLVAAANSEFRDIYGPDMHQAIEDVRRGIGELVMQANEK